MTRGAFTLPNINTFFKLTTSTFSLAWDNPEMRKLVGVLAWPHVLVRDSYYKVRIESGEDQKGYYAKIDDTTIRVIPDRATGYSFVCPACHNPVRVLYLPRLGGDVGCRECHKVDYQYDPTLDVEHWRQKLREFIDEQ